MVTYEREITRGVARGQDLKERRFEIADLQDGGCKPALLEAGRRSMFESGQPARDFLCILPTVEGGNPEEPFATGAEAAAGRDDNVQILQHPVEHLPARQASRCLDPDVGGIHAAVNRRIRALPM
jgi:hypothetical protein